MKRSYDCCQVVRIQGVLCHETDCPDNWKGLHRDCFECGCAYVPTDRFQRDCEDGQAMTPQIESAYKTGTMPPLLGYDK